MIAVGHDLVSLPEFEPLLQPRFIARAFTPDEAESGRATERPATFFALRWAAKEAAYKALCDLADSRGLSRDGLACFRDYEVPAAAGDGAAARLILSGAPRRLVLSAGADPDRDVTLCLDDEDGLSAAFVTVTTRPIEIDSTRQVA